MTTVPSPHSRVQLALLSFCRPRGDRTYTDELLKESPLGVLTALTGMGLPLLSLVELRARALWDGQPGL